MSLPPTGQELGPQDIRRGDRSRTHARRESFRPQNERKLEISFLRDRLQHVPWLASSLAALTAVTTEALFSVTSLRTRPATSSNLFSRARKDPRAACSGC